MARPVRTMKAIKNKQTQKQTNTETNKQKNPTHHKDKVKGKGRKKPNDCNSTNNFLPFNKNLSVRENTNVAPQTKI